MNWNDGEGSNVETELRKRLEQAEYVRQKALEHAARLEERLEKCEAALRYIAAWQFPPSGRTWEDGTPMSYSAAFGSNGQRDHMINAARVALEGK